MNILNNREISIVQYSTEVNWIDRAPSYRWLCVLVDNDRPRHYLNEVISKLINKGACYFCTIGDNCELNHDLIDEEIVFRECDIDPHYLPKHLIITTWHDDFDEGLWFAIYAPDHDEVEIKEVIIFDMTEGKEIPRINNLLQKFTTGN